MKTDSDFITEKGEKGKKDPANKNAAKKDPANKNAAKNAPTKNDAAKNSETPVKPANSTPKKTKPRQPRKSHNYDDIKSANISKKANLTTKDLDVMHNEIVKQLKFPSNIADIQNSAVKLGSNGPGKYYLKFTVKNAQNGIKVTDLPKLRLAIKHYIADYFNLSPSMVSKNLRDEDIIIFNKPKSKEFYTKFVISESVSSSITTNTLIDYVSDNRLDEADRLLSQIINNKLLTKIQSIIQK